VFKSIVIIFVFILFN